MWLCVCVCVCVCLREKGEKENIRVCDTRDEDTTSI